MYVNFYGTQVEVTKHSDKEPADSETVSIDFGEDDYPKFVELENKLHDNGLDISDLFSSLVVALADDPEL